MLPKCTTKTEGQHLKDNPLGDIDLHVTDFFFFLAASESVSSGWRGLPENLSLTSGSHKLAEENDSQELFSELHRL